MPSEMRDSETLMQKIERCKAEVAAMTPAERAEMYEAQRRSFIRAEAGFGSDADEAAYAAAIRDGNDDEVARLEAAAQQRIEAAEQGERDAE